ncbi:MAG: aminopeptidase [Chitinophaga sp.]|uniref:C1 family peptidase n=1 Tax=Chitinophaga sp. TaxID=1869181 RepID=UPI001B141846|nr:C1 family peptidase [Chitinophaga sp.]MBO9728218.1 aminopeptidase [Chitinophaga sp.]
MRTFCLTLAMFATTMVNAQEKGMVINNLVKGKINAATPVKNQGMSGTCWSFSSTSMVESECLRKGVPELDLSEMFTARNVYIEKAKNYVRRQGFARFDEGGLAHDVIRSIALYGIEPESVYSGLKGNATVHNHSEMVTTMKKYLDSIIKVSPVPDNWVSQFTGILDNYMGQPPATFEYNGKTYTPQTFAKEVVKFNADDYVFLTSFTHHPFYQSFIIEVPDNFSNGAYYNVPLKELTNITESALEKGYTVLWDADVSNRGFSGSKGYAMLPEPNSSLKKDSINPDMAEPSYTQESRQQLYEELITQDDHLMHITGIEKTPKGKTFFLVKNSWGANASPFGGYLNVSEAYFAVNTITIVVPKAALDKTLQKKFSLN